MKIELQVLTLSDLFGVVVRYGKNKNDIYQAENGISHESSTEFFTFWSLGFGVLLNYGCKDA